jgi:hypothetical protein
MLFYYQLPFPIWNFGPESIYFLENSGFVKDFIEKNKLINPMNIKKIDEIIIFINLYLENFTQSSFNRSPSSP